MSPQMTSSGTLAWTPTRAAGELLIAAGAGEGSPGAHWVETAVVVACSLAVALGAFWTAAKSRS